MISSCCPDARIPCLMWRHVSYKLNVCSCPSPRISSLPYRRLAVRPNKRIHHRTVDQLKYQFYTSPEDTVVGPNAVSRSRGTRGSQQQTTPSRAFLIRSPAWNGVIFLCVVIGRFGGLALRAVASARETVGERGGNTESGGVSVVAFSSFGTLGYMVPRDLAGPVQNHPAKIQSVGQLIYLHLCRAIALYRPLNQSMKQVEYYFI